MDSPPKQKTITLPLSKFLEYSFLKICDKLSIDNDTAYLFQAADSNETFIHVEYPTADNGLLFPRLWNIRDWRTHHEEYLRKKKEAAFNRLEANLLTENRERMKKAIARKFGLDPEMVSGIADKIARGKNQNAASNFGVTLDLQQPVKKD